RTLPPKSSTANCAATTEPFPLPSALGPFMSVSTPNLTTLSETWACTGDAAMQTAATKEMVAIFFKAFLPRYLLICCFAQQKFGKRLRRPCEPSHAMFTHPPHTGSVCQES